MNFIKPLRGLLINLLSLTLFTSCHYRLGYDGLSNQYKTISVPYVESDRDGTLTAEVIKQLATSSAFQYLTHGGDLILKISLIELSDENIGFCYDRNKKGHLKDTLIPRETRLKAIVNVAVIDRCSNQILRGPVDITAYIDFDHDFYSNRDSINIFSLGQLTDIDAAQESAIRYPLNRQIAKKIVDYVVNSW